jgi:oxalate decarboxylase
MLAGSGLLPAAVARAASQADASNPWPNNPTLLGQFPSSFDPPSTDHGDLPNLWFPFSRAHRRIQAGGWSRQVTVRDFPIAKSTAGVNMRLTAGGVRELHWHLPAEWAFMLTGRAQITSVDQNGRSYVADIGPGDLWNFPSGIPPSIQGLEPNGCEFLLAFDDGASLEFDGFSISDWVAHAPKEVLAKNLGWDRSVFAYIPSKELYIFQGKVSSAQPTRLAHQARCRHRSISPWRRSSPISKANMARCASAFPEEAAIRKRVFDRERPMDTRRSMRS